MKGASANTNLMHIDSVRDEKSVLSRTYADIGDKHFCQCQEQKSGLLFYLLQIQICFILLIHI